MIALNRIVGGICSLLVSVPVFADYRTNVPPVVEPPPAHEAAPLDLTSQFASAYQAAGRPRIAVYWNRQLTDTLSTQHEHVDRVTATDEVHETETNDDTKTEVGSATLRNKQTMSRHTQENTSGARIANADVSRDGIDEPMSWRLESSFYEPFLRTGARLVDRTMTMRALRNGQSYGETPDIQAVETSALMNKADYLMEILMTSDDESPIGCRFRVTIKNVNTGQIVGLASTRAIPATQSHTSFVPGEAGFVRRTVTQPASLEDVANQLAQETMYQLIRAWHPGAPA